MDCKICSTETEVQFNIKKRLVPVCSKCATAIFLQQSKFYAANQSIYNLPTTYKIAPPRHPEIAAEILNFLNEKLGKVKRYVPNATKEEKGFIPDVFLLHISARVEEGHTLRKMKAVVHLKHKEWGRDLRMKKFLRPATLFNKEKFNTYVLEVPEDFNPDNSQAQRVIIRELSNFGMRGVCNEETDKLAKQLMETGYAKKEFLNTYLIEKI
jgi:uncharacterized phage protein (TIGR02220 family)